MSDDFSELGRLERDLGTVPEASEQNVKIALGVTSNRIKKAWQGKVQGSPGLGGLAAAVTYEGKSTANAFESEIGYDKGRFQGPLGNISEFGSPSHPARGYGLASLQENEPDFVRGLERAVDDALGEVGL
jgi:hypothetical protein